MVLNFLKMLLRGSLFGVTFLMVFSSVAQSANMYRISSDYYSRFTSPDEACLSVPEPYNGVRDPIVDMSSQLGPDNWGCSFYYEWNNTHGVIELVEPVIDDCPAGYVENESGYCVIPPSCDVGMTAIVNIPVRDVGGSITLTIGNTDITVDDCIYSLGEMLGCFLVPDGSSICTYNATSTGASASGGGIVDPDTGTGAPPDYDSDVTTGSETTYAPTTTTNNPDGSTTTTDTTTTTTTTGDGTTIINQTDVTVIHNSNGTTTTVTTTTTTTSYPDGSSDETVTTETTNTGGGGTDTTVPSDPSSPPTEATFPAPPPSGGTETTTTTTDPDGNVTGTGTTTTGDPDGEGEGEEPPEPFDPVFHDGVGSFDDANIAVASDISTAKAELLTSFNTIKSEITALFSFTATGAGSLPCPPPVVIANFGEFDICMTEYESQLAFVAQVLFFVASFLAIAIILR